MSSDIVKIKVWIGTNKVGSECTDEFEMFREDWEEMSDEQKEELCKETAFQMMEWGWEET